MTLKSYLWGMRISTLLSFFAFCLVVCYTDPEKSGIPGKFIFFLTLFLLFSGVITIFLTWLRRTFGKEGVIFSELGMSFREGILLSLLLIVLLVLQSFRILVWWDGLLAVAAIFLIELYFLSK